MKALLQAIDDNRRSQFGSIPDDFKLSDRAFPTLAKVAFDFDAGALIDEAYVKRFRQRLQEEAVRTVRCDIEDDSPLLESD